MKIYPSEIENIIMVVKALETGFYTDCSSIFQSTKKWMGEYTKFSLPQIDEEHQNFFP